MSVKSYSATLIVLILLNYIAIICQAASLTRFNKISTHMPTVIHMMISHRPCWVLVKAPSIPSGPKDKIKNLNLLNTTFSNQCKGLAITHTKMSHTYETNRNAPGLKNKTHNQFCNNNNSNI